MSIKILNMFLLKLLTKGNFIKVKNKKKSLSHFVFSDDVLNCVTKRFDKSYIREYKGLSLVFCKIS